VPAGTDCIERANANSVAETETFVVGPETTARTVIVPRNVPEELPTTVETNRVIPAVRSVTVRKAVARARTTVFFPATEKLRVRVPRFTIRKRTGPAATDFGLMVNAVFLSVTTTVVAALRAPAVALRVSAASNARRMTSDRVRSM
jgi:hypothetical protein